MGAKAFGEHCIDMPYSDLPVKVFLADDSALIRARVAAMLATPAMTIVGQAETPQGCIAGIRATKPHVVVLDRTPLHTPSLDTRGLDRKRGAKNTGVPAFTRLRLRVVR